MLETRQPEAVQQAAPVAPLPAIAAAVAPAWNGGLSVDTVVALQRTAGNTAVARMLDPAGEAEAAGEGEPIELPAGMTFHQEPEAVVAYAAGPKLEGKTTATFDSLGRFDPDPPKAKAAKGCTCSGGTCMQVTGSFVVDYDSKPVVTLPDVPEGLTDCQRKNAQKFIREVLAPHEQEHVKAFRTHFDGTTKRKFDLKVCSAEELKQTVDADYVTELTARKTKAMDESNKLDANGANQFTWDMDVGCAP
jgi:hypothetical protein